MQDTEKRADIRARTANGLRLLADAIDTDTRIPLPQVQVVANSEEQVFAAAEAQRAQIRYRDGHTSATLHFDGVSVEVFHVSSERLARYAAEQSYSGVVQP